MKNIYGKTVYPKYEIALKQHVKGSVEDDYESVEFDGADNYREAVKMAKKYSLDIGSGNMRYKRISIIRCGSCASNHNMLLFRRYIRL